MVEFRFDIKPLFPQPIVKITSNLLPHTFRGDRRMALDTTSKMTEIIDRLGELSAASQKLSKAVTTSQRLRMSDNQKIYLLADVEAGHNGAVIGLLKVGTKSLYLFDESGETKKVDDAPCILDFYIHESRQRAGLGKDLFETMLAEENWTPIKLSIDRPSEKLLGFLKKHYGMEKTIPQSNNFVLYEGFFGPPSTENNNQQHANGLHITDSPNTALFGPHFIGDDNKKRIRQQDIHSPSTQITQISPVGRYAAPRPTCSMAEAMKNESELSLTASQVLKLEKSNALRKNPLDAITRPPKINQYLEKRSGLQNVKDDNYNNYFSTPTSQKNAGFGHPEPRMHNNNPGQHIHQPDNNSTSAGAKAPMEMENKAPPSEPRLEDTANAGNVPDQSEKGFCTTCPNCSARIILVPESENNAGAQKQIIHSTTKPSTGETSSKLSNADDAVKEENTIDSLCGDLQTLQTSPFEVGQNINPETTDEAKLEIAQENINNVSVNLAHDEPRVEADGIADNFSQPKKPTSFQLSKQHTGLKNISFNVGLAVTPTNKMEFDQEQTDEFGIVKINRPPGKLVSPPPPDNTDAMSTVSSGEGFTDQGYYDLKFYHNKLW